MQDVLIIEDNPLVRRSLERAFVKEGYTVATAGDGEEALRDLVEGDGPPKIIIMDLIMPMMDGWQLRQRLLDGEEALRDLVEGDGPPKIIIMDLIMPVMDGWQLRQRLLENDSWARVPVIALSGAGVDDTDKTLPGVVCILKPVSMATLFENVARLIAGTFRDRMN